MQYFLIHGPDVSREAFMKEQFDRFGIPQESVTWILWPNKGDLTDDFSLEICKNPALRKGQISCTYKHYLALKAIVDQDLPYAVIMEDNIEFRTNVPKFLYQIMTELPTNWDLVFDSDILDMHIQPERIIEGQHIYEQSNQPGHPTHGFHGSSRGANFILVSNSAAKKLIQQWVPITFVSDHQYNLLALVNNLRVFWTEPPNVHKVSRESTAL